MLSAIIPSMEYSFSAILDITLLSILLYYLFLSLIKIKALLIMRGFIVLLLIYCIAYIFKLETVLWLLNYAFSVLTIGFFIIFQSEIRAIILEIGKHGLFNIKKDEQQITIIDLIVQVVEYLSHIKRGALLCFVHDTYSIDILSSGVALNADISKELLLSIFEYDSSLHDGAVLIHNTKLLAAGCLLPLSIREDIESSFGTRHHAALGMAEQSDALVVIVSEETGAISIAIDGYLSYDITVYECMRMLQRYLYKEGSI